MHMFRKYRYTQVTRHLKEIDHICIFILKGSCMEVFTLRNVISNWRLMLFQLPLNKEKQQKEWLVQIKTQSYYSQLNAAIHLKFTGNVGRAKTETEAYIQKRILSSVKHAWK